MIPTNKPVLGEPIPDRYKVRRFVAEKPTTPPEQHQYDIRPSTRDIAFEEKLYNRRP